MKHDLVAVGDTGTDAFIRLTTPSAHIDIDKGKREIALKFAAKIPYEAVYVVPGVGNSANAAVGASRLGVKTALISNIGDDYFGKECLDVFKKEKVETKFIKKHKGAKTNYHYVLWFEDDRTILTKHEPFKREWPRIDAPEWMYLSSLGPDALAWHDEIKEYLDKYPSVNLVFQPGGYQITASAKLQGFYSRAKVVIVNKEEAQTILGTDADDIKKLLSGMKELGPETAVITDGVKGAYAACEGEHWYMPPYPDPKPPLERTGAGDAFASTFVASLCKGMSATEALRRAPINSMSVVQYVGAREGLLTQNKLEEYLRVAPKDYEPRVI